MSGGGDLSGFSMLELFRVEAETQMGILSRGLVELENTTDSAALLKELMRAAHSIKGAARIVNYEPAVHVAHAMEDCLVAAQTGKLQLRPAHIDALLNGVDLITEMAQISETDLPGWQQVNAARLKQCIRQLDFEADPVPSSPATLPPVTAEASAPAITLPSEPAAEEPMATPQAAVPPTVADRALRITAENLNRLLALAGESLLATRGLDNFATELLQLKRYQQQLAVALHGLEEAAMGDGSRSHMAGNVNECRTRAAVADQYLNARIDEFDLFQRIFTALSSRLYQVVLDCRMRPFADVAQGFPRMVRDVARTLGKEARLEILGLTTPIDRDIMDRLEAPLSHLLRNALDHGMEFPEDRMHAGKARQGLLKLEAGHSAGTLLIEITDDGRGIDVENLRRQIVARQFASAEIAEKMSEAELFEFLYLPNFSLKREVTEISGRGVGLDAVQSMVREVGGEMRVSSKRGAGTRFQMFLPLTRSVLRTLVVQIANEPYAFPLAKIHSVTKISREQIETVEGRQHFTHQGEKIGLVVAHQVLGLDYNSNGTTELPVIVLEDHGRMYGVLVDKLLDERELVVIPLDRRLGKVSNVSSAALLPDRSPILILDTNDIIRSIEHLVSGERLYGIARAKAQEENARTKRLLVVDDSLTVRELERKLLSAGGYEVDTAVDGLDGWGALRTGNYDLLITDVDMPRMDGIELVHLVRKDARFKSLPIVIVSYKDRPEDRQRGLDGGADYYLTKTSFQDQTLLRVVHDLVGDAAG